MVRVHNPGYIGLLFGKHHWRLVMKISDLSFSKFPPKNCPIVHFVGESSLRLHTFVSAPLSWGGFIWKTRPGKIIFWMFISGGRDAQQLAHAPQHLLALRLRCQHGEYRAHQECWDQKSFPISNCQRGCKWEKNWHKIKPCHPTNKLLILISDWVCLWPDVLGGRKISLHPQPANPWLVRQSHMCLSIDFNWF